MTMRLTTNLSGDVREPRGASTLREASSATADLAFRLSLMGCLAPAVWMLSCVTHRWSAIGVLGLTGYIISLGIPVLLTLWVSRVAIRQIQTSHVPLAGMRRAHQAIAIAVAALVFWIFANWLIAHDF